MVRARTNNGNCRGPGHEHSLPAAAHSLPGCIHHNENNDRVQAGGMHMHSWKDKLDVDTRIPANGRRQGLIWAHKQL